MDENKNLTDTKNNSGADAGYKARPFYMFSLSAAIKYLTQPLPETFLKDTDIVIVLNQDMQEAVKVLLKMAEDKGAL